MVLARVQESGEEYIVKMLVVVNSIDVLNRALERGITVQFVLSSTELFNIFGRIPFTFRLVEKLGFFNTNDISESTI